MTTHERAIEVAKEIVGLPIEDAIIRVHAAICKAIHADRVSYGPKFTGSNERAKKVVDEAIEELELQKHTFNILFDLVEHEIRDAVFCAEKELVEKFKERIKDVCEGLEP